MEDEEPAREDGEQPADAEDVDATATETPGSDGSEGGDGADGDGEGGRHTFGPPDGEDPVGDHGTDGDEESREADEAEGGPDERRSPTAASSDADPAGADEEQRETDADGEAEDGGGGEETADGPATASAERRTSDTAAGAGGSTRAAGEPRASGDVDGREGTAEAGADDGDVDRSAGGGETGGADGGDVGGPAGDGATAGATTAARQATDEGEQDEGRVTAEGAQEADGAEGTTGAEAAEEDGAGADASDAPDRVAKYDRFKKIESSEYDRVNDFLRKRTYITAREWAIARLCSDFRTETGVEMTLIGENLPELIPFMTDTYSPQAVNQARASFRDKVKKAGSTFLYGSMSGFFTTEELDDVMYEVTETARFLLEVEGAEVAAEHEMEVEDRISDAMREIQEGSAELRAEETEHTCPHCGGEFTEDEEP